MRRRARPPPPSNPTQARIRFAFAGSSSDFLVPSQPSLTSIPSPSLAPDTCFYICLHAKVPAEMPAAKSFERCENKDILVVEQRRWQFFHEGVRMQRRES